MIESKPFALIYKRGENTGSLLTACVYISNNSSRVIFNILHKHTNS